jgi:hypothetical protein
LSASPWSRAGRWAASRRITGRRSIPK